MSTNSTQFEKMSNHSKLITIIKKLNTKRKNIKQTSNKQSFVVLPCCRWLVKAVNMLGIRLTFEGVPKDPRSHGAHQNHISLLESYSLGVDGGEVGDYMICISIIVKTGKLVTYARILLPGRLQQPPAMLQEHQIQNGDSRRSPTQFPGPTGRKTALE
jgi:hypothetical protein